MEIKLGKNQYLLSERDDITGYRCKIHIDQYYMYLGDACNYYEYKSKIYVVGYAVDVEKPHYTIEEMCAELDNKLAQGLIGPESTRDWNGRWIILVLTEQGIAAWGDCCGLKQLFYDVGEGIFCIASQARYIAQIYGYEEDPVAEAYIKQAEEMDKEYSWPLYKTAYADVKRLLPNHYILDGRVSRASLNKEKGSPQRAEMLIANSLSAASKLAPLAVTLTAGWDSRLVLSGCSNIDNYSAVTLKYDWMELDHQDIRIAEALAKKKKIEYSLIDCGNVSNEFRTEYMQHSEYGHEYWTQMAQAVIDGGFSKSIWVKGSCNEIIRNSFGVLYNWQVNAKVLCKLFKLPFVPYVIEALNDWLPEAKKYCKTNQISVLDLFYWEHRMGSWLAACLNEADIASEMFSPFNSRTYLENGLSVKCRDRIAPQYRFFETIIEKADLKNNISVNGERYQSLKARMKIIIKNHLHLLYGILLRF